MFIKLAGYNVNNGVNDAYNLELGHNDDLCEGA